MKIRLLESRVGKNYQRKGTIIEVSRKEALSLINAGLGERIIEFATEKVDKRKKGVKYART